MNHRPGTPLFSGSQAQGNANAHPYAYPHANVGHHNTMRGADHDAYGDPYAEIHKVVSVVVHCARDI